MILSYQQWDLIADAYSPALAIVSLSIIATKAYRDHWKAAKAESITLVLSLAFIYSLMFLDNKLDIWQAFNLDYSTHTAFALVFVAHIYQSGKMSAVVVIASFIAYMLLMIHQNYHTLFDIASTGIAVLPMIAALLYFNNKKYSSSKTCSN